MNLTKAVTDVLAERQRQISFEGWTPEHDDEHRTGGMAVAAACYAAWSMPSLPASEAVGAMWPWTGWAQEWFKPKGTRHNLVRAGALILAEIERLDRRPQGRCSNPECGWQGALADAVVKDGEHFCPYNGFDAVKPNSSAQSTPQPPAQPKP